MKSYRVGDKIAHSFLGEFEVYEFFATGFIILKKRGWMWSGNVEDLVVNGFIVERLFETSKDCGKRI